MPPSTSSHHRFAVRCDRCHRRNRFAIPKHLDLETCGIDCGGCKLELDIPQFLIDASLDGGSGGGVLPPAAAAAAAASPPTSQRSPASPHAHAHANPNGMRAPRPMPVRSPSPPRRDHRLPPTDAARRPTSSISDTASASASAAGIPSRSASPAVSTADIKSDVKKPPFDYLQALDESEHMSDDFRKEVEAVLELRGVRDLSRTNEPYPPAFKRAVVNFMVSHKLRPKKVSRLFDLSHDTPARWRGTSDQLLDFPYRKSSTVEGADGNEVKWGIDRPPLDVKEILKLLGSRKQGKIWQPYPPKFKREVVRYMDHHGIASRAAAGLFGIGSHQQPARWRWQLLGGEEDDDGAGGEEDSEHSDARSPDATRRHEQHGYHNSLASPSRSQSRGGGGFPHEDRQRASRSGTAMTDADGRRGSLPPEERIAAAARHSRSPIMDHRSSVAARFGYGTGPLRSQRHSPPGAASGSGFEHFSHAPHALSPLTLAMSQSSRYELDRLQMYGRGIDPSVPPMFPPPGYLPPGVDLTHQSQLKHGGAFPPLRPMHSYFARKFNAYPSPRESLRSDSRGRGTISPPPPALKVKSEPPPSFTSTTSGGGLARAVASYSKSPPPALERLPRDDDDSETVASSDVEIDGSSSGLADLMRTFDLRTDLREQHGKSSRSRSRSPRDRMRRSPKHPHAADSRTHPSRSRKRSRSSSSQQQVNDGGGGRAESLKMSNVVDSNAAAPVLEGVVNEAKGSYNNSAADIDFDNPRSKRRKASTGGNTSAASGSGGGGGGNTSDGSSTGSGIGSGSGSGGSHRKKFFDIDTIELTEDERLALLDEIRPQSWPGRQRSSTNTRKTWTCIVCFACISHSARSRHKCYRYLLNMPPRAFHFRGRELSSAERQRILRDEHAGTTSPIAASPKEFEDAHPRSPASGASSGSGSRPRGGSGRGGGDDSSSGVKAAAMSKKRQQLSPAQRSPAAVDNDSKPNLEKRFKCLHCPRRFVHKRNMSRHMTVHTDDPRLVCSDCKKRFHYPGQLSNHKPYCKANGTRRRNRPNGGGGRGGGETAADHDERHRGRGGRGGAKGQFDEDARMEDDNDGPSTVAAGTAAAAARARRWSNSGAAEGEDYQSEDEEVAGARGGAGAGDESSPSRSENPRLKPPRTLSLAERMARANMANSVAAERDAADLPSARHHSVLARFGMAPPLPPPPPHVPDVDQATAAAAAAASASAAARTVPPYLPLPTSPALAQLAAAACKDAGKSASQISLLAIADSRGHGNAGLAYPPHWFPHNAPARAASPVAPSAHPPMGANKRILRPRSGSFPYALAPQMNDNDEDDPQSDAAGGGNDEDAGGNDSGVSSGAEDASDGEYGGGGNGSEHSTGSTSPVAKKARSRPPTSGEAYPKRRRRSSGVSTSNSKKRGIFPCSLGCGQSFTFDYNRKRHEKNVHKGSSPAAAYES